MPPKTKGRKSAKRARRVVRADPNRTHPDDLAHRTEIREFIERARAGMGMRTTRGAFLVTNGDWRMSTLLGWAFDAQFQLSFDFKGLDVPAEFLMAPPDETIEQWLARSKAAIRHVRLALEVSKIDMDVRLKQERGVYNTWELRKGSYLMSAMQRSIRALGGEYKLIFEHKHNPGLVRRLTKR